MILTVDVVERSRDGKSRASLMDYMDRMCDGAYS